MHDPRDDAPRVDLAVQRHPVERVQEGHDARQDDVEGHAPEEVTTWARNGEFPVCCSFWNL